jgi:hypothetical protein
VRSVSTLASVPLCLRWICDSDTAAALNLGR